jgi:hypothetical protein|tara:strand:+ start:7122 stop:7298 length:177 start_codon:yes stop_codon:yes gene_type:complete
MVKEVRVKGYYRKNGSYVASHVRKIKTTPKKYQPTTTRSKKYTNKNQLTLDLFSGTTQ